MTTIGVLRRTTTLLSSIILFAASAAAQSAPIGPPLNKTSTATLAVSVMTNVLRTRAQTAVDETNARLRDDGESARVSIESLRVNKPFGHQTEMLNRPNSRFVRVSHSLTIKVAIPHVLDRHIHIPIDVDVFCDDWYTNHGTVGVRAIPGPASIEGGSILEDVIHVRDHIDAKVRRAFNPPLPVFTSLSATRCSSIGPFDNGTATVSDDAVAWDVPRPPQVIDSPVARPTVIVTFERLKRLRARTLKGAILYQDVEDILLNAFANYSPVQKALAMREGDDVALNLPAIRLDPRTFPTLVIIAGIEQPPNDPKDSTFVPSGNVQNGFATGSHLQISKSFSEVNPATKKPIEIRVPAYELRYTVTFVNSGLIAVR
jgi:hypothetical protein